MTTAADHRPLRYEPDYAVAPGDTLRATLIARGMTQSDLATRTGLSPKHINQVIQGVAPISHETALVLEKVTGVPAKIWNRLEDNYRDRLARTEDREYLASDAKWLQTLPIKELTKRGVITKGADVGTQLQEACRFFGVANRESWENVWRAPLASFRKSKAFESDDGAVAAWLRLGELEAADIPCEPFDARKFRSALQEIRSLTILPIDEAIPALVSLCAAAGVAVVFVPEIKGTRASGAARWVTPTKAVIQLSLRHKTDDHLWFSFFHEAGHVLLHSKKETFITGDPSADAAEEEANDFSANHLIPKRLEPELLSLASDGEIVGFAERIGIAPGIVVGRLQKEDVLDWSQGNHHKRRLTFSES